MCNNIYSWSTGKGKANKQRIEEIKDSKTKAEKSESRKNGFRFHLHQVTVRDYHGMKAETLHTQFLALAVAL